MTDALIVLGLIPLAWSAIVWALAHIDDHVRGAPTVSDDAEKFTLAVMLAPIALGLSALLISKAMPQALSPLPPILPLMDEALGAPRIAGDVAPAGGPDMLRAAALALLAAYGAGVVGFGGRLLIARRRIARAIASANDAAATLGPQVRVGGDDLPPFAARNCIVLPTAFLDALDAEALGLIVAHERAHIDRGDPAWFEALALIDVLFWMNPFVRMQTARCRLAAEIDADRRVAGGAPEMRKVYAKTLLAALSHTAGDAPPCAPAVFSPRSIGDTRMRITEIMAAGGRTGKTRRRALIAALALLAAPVAAAQFGYAATTSRDAPRFTHMPIEAGRITSRFGPRTDPFNGNKAFHSGVDIAAPEGTPIYAPADGEIVRVMVSADGYGNMLEVDHGNGVISRYAQLSAFQQESGRVKAGELIARVGSTGRSTGPHLHLELFIDGERVNPEDHMVFPGAITVTR